jgi:predicted acylesterase/phospholipase RssA
MPRAIALRLSWPECSRPLNIERKEHTMSWDRSPLDAVNVIRKQANGQVVLVLQGGGALGAYQGGVYEALHEAKVEPDWIIGTSIGAINASIIAGNAVEHRLDRLREFGAACSATRSGALCRPGPASPIPCRHGRP